jgi:DNA modification methylase
MGHDGWKLLENHKEGVVKYEEFLKKKMKTITDSGFEPNGLNENLFPFQSWIVKRALKAGKYAIFADCGLGKTFMQLEWARSVADHTNGEVLILAPLAVTDQTMEQAQIFGIALDGITVTNYEQIENIDCSRFTGIVLDESSILKNFQGQTKKKIVDSFKNTPYKLACTATPSPNDPEELGNHSEFLGVMPRTEMLAMYFVHDAGDTGEWRIKGHAVKHFWQWVSTWAVMLNDPKEIGFPMDGYHLPGLEMVDHKIITPIRGDGGLFNDTAISATDFNAELRRTKIERLTKAAEIANSTKDQVIVWIKQNEEGDFLKDLIPDAVEVRGDDTAEVKKKNLMGFAHGAFRVLITKAKIAQFGLNYQNCHVQVFASLDFSFEGLYQAMRRSYRFGQKNNVQIHLITTDTMTNVVEAIATKNKNFREMQKQMSDAMNANLKHEMMTAASYNTDTESNEWFRIDRGDCVQKIKTVPDESVGFSVFSPPFADLFTYSSHIEDMGNCSTFDDFVIQFGFLVKELYRVMKQGRNVAVHCMDLPIQKGKEGFIGLRDFSGMIRQAFENEGFIYHSRVTIWKDPVTEMQRTKALGLLHKQVKKDSTMSRVGIPDTVLIFRKDGERSDPVTNEGIDVDTWQKYASPVWMDIDQGDTLNGRIARDEEDEKHLCPLQLPVIKRLVHLYSNPGDVVLTPFLGIGSELYQSIKMGRRGIGFELKESYFSQAKKNLLDAVKEKAQGELF